MLPSPATTLWSSSSVFGPLAASREGAGEVGGVKGLTERLGTHRRESRMGFQVRGVDQIHVPEAAGVEVGEGAPGIGLEDDVSVFGIGGRGEREFARRFGGAVRLYCETAGHAQVHHQRLVPIERGEDVLAASGQRDDTRAGQPLDESVGQRESQVGRRAATLTSPSADQMRLQATPDGFDLGKFGHGPA